MDKGKHNKKMYSKKIISTVSKVLCMVIALSLFMSVDVHAKEKTYTVNGEKITFDAEYYANTYADVKSALGTDEKALLNHYVTYGRNEGRSPYVNAMTIDTAQIEKSLLDKINALRKNAGVSELKLSSDLNKVAAVRVKEISGKYSHTRPDGSDFTSAFMAVDPKYGAVDNQVAENVVYTSTNGKNSAVISDDEIKVLKNSKEHYDRMVSADFNYVGIASYQINGKNYVVFEFSTK